MGLDTTHDAWHGAYSEFMRWRQQIGTLCGLGELSSFEGYNGTRLLSDIQDEGIRILLSHSDCDGELTPDECRKIGNSLDMLLSAPINDEDLGGHIGLFREKTRQFIAGCYLAHEKGETMYFR